jgi:hypothetical protein
MCLVESQSRVTWLEKRLSRVSRGITVPCDLAREAFVSCLMESQSRPTWHWGCSSACLICLMCLTESQSRPTGHWGYRSALYHCK